MTSNNRNANPPTDIYGVRDRCNKCIAQGELCSGRKTSTCVRCSWFNQACEWTQSDAALANAHTQPQGGRGHEQRFKPSEPSAPPIPVTPVHPDWMYNTGPQQAIVREGNTHNANTSHGESHETYRPSATPQWTPNGGYGHVISPNPQGQGQSYHHPVQPHPHHRGWHENRAVGEGMGSNSQSQATYGGYQVNYYGSTYQ
ncbi:hypothetical protein DL96DRAFT_1607160 [Flagelloscypha sp. PMI_526]|nr:hypothetical protein DL96DRAFT_1607160 [Flagelloscypha sp. PMI_526]